MARVLADGVGAKVTIVLGTESSPTTVAAWPADPARSSDRTDGPSPSVTRVSTSERSRWRRLRPNALDPTREKLVADVAAQAGLVLRNAALIEDLRASRQRLVAAQDQERRRIERNIHDGAQQQLVALAVKLKLADALVGKDEERTHAMLADLQTETNQALEDLRDLARGIYPPLLADKGLGAALESQARKSAVPVSVETDGIGRYPQEAEAAVYFSLPRGAPERRQVRGGLGARTIRLAQTDGMLAFEVDDDGRGFDPATASRGTGLQGIADRLAALGGTIEIESAAGAGTTVRGRIPATEPTR